MNETRILKKQNTQSNDGKPSETQKQQLQKQQARRKMCTLSARKLLKVHGEKQSPKAFEADNRLLRTDLQPKSAQRQPPIPVKSWKSETRHDEQRVNYCPGKVKAILAFFFQASSSLSMRQGNDYSHINIIQAAVG